MRGLRNNSRRDTPCATLPDETTPFAPRLCCCFRPNRVHCCCGLCVRPRPETGTGPRSCHWHDPRSLLLPGQREIAHPRCTPGSIDPIVTQSNIGRPSARADGPTRTCGHRSPGPRRLSITLPTLHTARLSRRKQNLTTSYTLELGGSNDATNLWPEYPPTPNPKDKVENARKCRRL